MSVLAPFQWIPVWILSIMFQNKWWNSFIHHCSFLQGHLIDTDVATSSRNQFVCEVGQTMAQKSFLVTIARTVLCSIMEVIAPNLWNQYFIHDNSALHTARGRKPFFILFVGAPDGSKLLHILPEDGMVNSWWRLSFMFRPHLSFLPVGHAVK